MPKRHLLATGPVADRRLVQQRYCRGVRFARLGKPAVLPGADYGHIFEHFAVEYTYQDGTKLFSQNRYMPGCRNNILHHGYGTEGHAQFGAGKIEGRTNWRMREKPANPYQVEHDVLFDAIRNDKPRNEADYAARSTPTAIMGRMAGYSGKEVTWDQAFNSTQDLSPSAYTWDAQPCIVPDADGRYRGIARISQRVVQQRTGFVSSISTRLCQPQRFAWVFERVAEGV